MRPVAIWIWFCAWLNCAGWFLSAVHELNTGGYIIALVIWFGSLILGRGCFFPGRDWGSPGKFARRFQRFFPLAFLVLTAMAFLGGILYPPTNYDALAYRLPRVLHWLADGRWHWIHTIFDRINDRSCGIEWVSAPFIAIFHTDRFLFLINFISFLLLPGLTFEVFTGLGVRRRVAWHWMWLMPSGYGFLLQAGSIGNDLFGAPFVLAAMAFAFRAARSQSVFDLCISILSAAMSTSAKTSDLPLLLPWALAIFPCLRWAIRKPLTLAAVSALAIFASALPTMALNQKYYGDWSGARLNGASEHAVAVKSAANVILLTLGNFVPPVFPADRWNHAMDTHLPPALVQRTSPVMEANSAKFYLPQMQTEEDSGLGFGLSVLLCMSAAAVFVRRKQTTAVVEPGWRKAVRWAPILSFLAVLTQSNLAAIARIIIPYYPLMLPPILAFAGHERLVRERWWRFASLLVFAMAGVLLVISPARPLFPALTIAKELAARHPGSHLATRINEVYLVYRQRSDAFAPAKAILPPDLKVLGLTTFDEPETSLWRPFGSRRIVHICPEDTSADLKSRGVEYILAKQEWFGKWYPGTCDAWLKQVNGQVIQTVSLNLRASAGPMDWYLIKLE